MQDHTGGRITGRILHVGVDPGHRNSNTVAPAPKRNSKRKSKRKSKRNAKRCGEWRVRYTHTVYDQLSRGVVPNLRGGGTVSVIHPLVVMNRRLEQALQSKSLSAAEEDKTLKFGSQVMLVNHKSEGDFWFPAG